MRAHKARSNRLKRYVVCLLLVLALGIGAVAGAPHAAAQLRSWKMLPQAEQFSEIYFTNPNTLPHTYTPGQQQAVSFTVSNHYTAAQNYSYIIFADTPAGVVSLGEGVFEAAPNTAHRIDNTVNLADLGPRIRITIVIKNGNDQQSITYWTTRKSA
ncbi:MAG TPA: hypothetical protein VGO07_04275 [Candidatus Saccharimonadales bacterium]|jgi:hypothetical protein|nr:hypothetical protein [Candidatus Saccharimonadales bacterium]